MASQPDTIGPSLFADSHYAPTDDARVVRRRQVFERARAGTTQGYKALAEYIVSTQDYGSLDSLLDILEARLLPPMPLDVSDPRVAVQLEVAMAALLDVSAVFRCFIAVPHHPQISACKTRCLEMLVERWSDVMKWLAYLLLNASSFANPPNILGTCIDTLLPIIVSAEKDILKEELLYLPYTIDYVYLLLCQVDKYTGKYYYLQLTKYGEMCAILNLFKSFIDSEIAFFNLLPRLKAVSPKTRKRIISALTVRAPQIAESAEATEAKSMMSAMYSLYTLIYCTSQLLCDPSLWTIFLEMGFLKEHGRALAIIAEKGHMSEVDPGDQFWKLLCATVILFVKTVVMKRTPNPTESFPSAMEGGILTSALRCLTHLDPTEKGTSGIIDDAITVILSYLPVEKVWKMAGSDDVYDALKDARRQSQGAKLVCREIQRTIEWGNDVYIGRKKIQVNMCSNLKHPKPKPAAPSGPFGMMQKAPEVVLRTCSSCHTVSYCSKSCQEQDWKDFHSRECATFSKWYKDRKAQNTWTSAKVRRGQLAYLEDLANEMLPPLPDLRPGRTVAGVRQLSSRSHNPSSAKSPPESYHPDSIISLFDWVSHEGLASRCKYPLAAYHRACWQYINLEWDPRIQQCVKDMEKDPNITLVEGIFMYNASLSMFVFAKLRYDAEAPVGQKYRVVNSAFRMGPRSVTEEIYGAYGED